MVEDITELPTVIQSPKTAQACTDNVACAISGPSTEIANTVRAIAKESTERRPPIMTASAADTDPPIEVDPCTMSPWSIIEFSTSETQPSATRSPVSETAPPTSKDSITEHALPIFKSLVMEAYESIRTGPDAEKQDTSFNCVEAPTERAPMTKWSSPTSTD